MCHVGNDFVSTADADKYQCPSLLYSLVSSLKLLIQWQSLKIDISRVLISNLPSLMYDEQW